MKGLTDNQKLLVKHLKEKISEEKRFYKSKHIGRELGMSAKSIGANLDKLSKNYTPLVIKRWSETDSFTWMIEPKKRSKTKINVT